MKYISSILLLSFLLQSCAFMESTKISPQQRRAMQIKTFRDTSYNNVFRAFKTILQDNGYIIQNQDYKGGLITAEAQKTNSAAIFFASISSDPRDRAIGRSFQVTVNLEKIAKKIVETRLILQEKKQYQLGGTTGSEIVNPKLYKTIYQKVSVEIKRRQAQGRE